MFLKACLNGARERDFHPAVPLTVDELAADAAAVVAAGAGALHLHPRDAKGRESLSADAVDAALLAVRAAVPGIPVGISSHAGIAPGGEARWAPARDWREMPDFISVNLEEPDAPEVIHLMRQQGVGWEAGLFSIADVERYLTLPEPDSALRVMIEIDEQDRDVALGRASAMLARLRAAKIRPPILLHGFDATVWPLYAEALRLGLDGRVGLEDGRTLPDGSVCAGNVAMIEAAAKMAADMAGHA